MYIYVRYICNFHRAYEWWFAAATKLTDKRKNLTYNTRILFPLGTKFSPVCTNFFVRWIIESFDGSPFSFLRFWFSILLYSRLIISNQLSKAELTDEIIGSFHCKMRVSSFDGNEQLKLTAVINVILWCRTSHIKICVNLHRPKIRFTQLSDITWR